MLGSTTFIYVNDPLPLVLLLILAYVLEPRIQAFTNQSFHDSKLTDNENIFLIFIIFKNLQKETEKLNNYRPVSHLATLSTIIEHNSSPLITQLFINNNILHPQ